MRCSTPKRSLKSRAPCAEPVANPRVIGIDPGTVSIDVCGLEGDRVFLDRSIPTRDAVSDPETFVAMLDAAGPVDCIVGPSGYGMPVTRGDDVTEETLRTAFLAAPGESGGIGGLTALARRLAAASSAARPVVFIPGVVHLASVPAYRKVNRVDLGTADKVCATVLAIVEQMARRGCRLDEVSLILVEMGGAFTAGVAVSAGRIVDGVGGSAGPMGFRAGGAWDGEVAFLADHVTKGMVFSGGVVSAWGDEPTSEGWEAFVEGVVKLVATLMVSVPAPAEIVLSGRLAFTEPVYRRCVARLSHVARVERLVERKAARGAALIGDGLVGGARRELVEWLGIPSASGSVLDHLVVITPAAARARLGLA
jgi:predicted butyrate kinase (DUF1464 family)